MKLHLHPLCAALLLTAVAAAAQGTFIYDQQSSTTNGAGRSASPFTLDNQPLGQSFAPSLPSVGFVEFEFTEPGFYNIGATGYVNLRSGSITGPILGSTDPVFITPGTNFHVATFLFTTPLDVTPGTTYYLQPVWQGGDPGMSIVEDFFNYPGGDLYSNGTALPGLDLWFREGVIPEPTTWALLLTGALLLYLRRRR